MRALILAATALLVAIASCSPIYSPTGCPKPCPSSCPDVCLPSGYCSESHWEPPASPPLVRWGPTTDLDIALGDLPPDATVAISFHGVLDLADRGDSVPWDYWIDLELANSDNTTTTILDTSEFNAIDFPIIGDWSGQGETDATGVLRLDFIVAECWDRRGRQDSGCVFLPSSSVTARLLDPTPWEAAPACP